MRGGLREYVVVETTTDMRVSGSLFVGADGLPELRLDGQLFTPATLPAAWTIHWRRDNETDVLFDAWGSLIDLRREIADAQREQETPEPEDDITASKRQRALEDENGR